MNLAITEVYCFVFDEALKVIMPRYFDFDKTTDYDFVGYIAVGIVAKLFPLYCPTTSHQTDDLVGPLHLPMHNTVIGLDGKSYMVYNCAGPDVLRLARHPKGYYPWSGIDIASLANMSDSGGSVDFNHLPPFVSEDTSLAHDEPQIMILEGLTNQRSQGGSWVINLANVISEDIVSTQQSQTAQKTVVVPKKKKKAQEKDNLKWIQQFPNWNKALAYTRALLRLAVCRGDVGNPYDLLHQPVARAELLQNVWPQALCTANIRPDQLESVNSPTTNKHLTHAEILVFIKSWLMLFVYNVKRLVGCSAYECFGLDHITAKILLLETIHGILQCFMEPKSSLLPIKANGFAWFLGQPMAKEIAWHVVFRHMYTNGVTLVLADLEPTTFKGAAHPPMATLVLMSASCFGGTLETLVNLEGIKAKEMPYPSQSVIYSGLFWMGPVLTAQHHDSDHPMLMFNLGKLCNVIITEVARLGRPKKATTGQKITVHKVKEAHLGKQTFVPTYQTSSNTYFLDIEHTDNALNQWLQTHGTKVLPDSLFITASVLFGWVDPHDLIALLDTSLRVVTTQMQLQQEEESCTLPFVQKEQCLMEDRMYRAQMEVSLFSKAMANLCEELDTPNHSPMSPVPKTLSSLDGTYVKDSDSADSNCFKLTEGVREKCEAWLLACNTSTVGTSASQILLHSPQYVTISHPHEHLLRVRVINAMRERVF
ncbi:uncharacterized protein F5891DRAFT_983433 [Suillus fuscotomentosus]|uniref:Uncharacterized protein n=1 Tax=Suillus fuscotomentosus TaxID=1912939 RepID=A0AAD4DYG7_9AGAM|nr:uncharacterized protein F5891DRAFT_983433 [Suillus fuscotomentosus]KAG1896424.1 hypothetical protein F5891DRAFT_983433 [Suillus fuscotomentosus]